MRKVVVMQVVIRALGTVTKCFEKWIEKLDLDLTIKALQKPCLVGRARMIQQVLIEYESEKNKWTLDTGWCPLLWHFHREFHQT